jgi:hypothetical protein
MNKTLNITMIFFMIEYIVIRHLEKSNFEETEFNFLIGCSFHIAFQLDEVLRGLRQDLGCLLSKPLVLTQKQIPCHEIL